MRIKHVLSHCTPLALILLLVGCSCSQAPKVLDNQSAIAANDLTALVSGCGQQVTSGYLVCRMTEGQDATNQYLIVHTPPNLNCDQEACTYFKVFFPSGRPTYEGSIKKGEFFAKIPWSELINKTSFDRPGRGFYGISITVHYKAQDGFVRHTYSNGYVFVHIIKSDYVSLSENPEDENFAWKWKTEKNQEIKLTTGYRVYVSPPSKDSKL